jgi:hypothetical protein
MRTVCSGERQQARRDAFERSSTATAYPRVVWQRSCIKRGPFPYDTSQGLHRFSACRTPPPEDSLSAIPAWTQDAIGSRQKPEHPRTISSAGKSPRRSRVKPLSKSGKTTDAIMERGIEFIESVHSTIASRGRTHDYIEDAVKVACNLPSGMTVEEIAGAFVRWYYHETPDMRDGPVLHLLTRRPRSSEAK